LAIGPLIQPSCYSWGYQIILLSISTVATSERIQFRGISLVLLGGLSRKGIAIVVQTTPLERWVQVTSIVVCYTDVQILVAVIWVIASVIGHHALVLIDALTLVESIVLLAISVISYDSRATVLILADDVVPQSSGVQWTFIPIHVSLLISVLFQQFLEFFHGFLAFESWGWALVTIILEIVWCF
jgi:hypothetical protein